jgi:hypothetical protein
MNKEEWSRTYRYQEHGHKYFDADFKFLWPKADESLHGDIPTLAHLDTDVFPLIKEKGVVVQAGGAMGMWAKRMAQVFDAVYTFEPTPQSFHCLNFNVPEENVVKFNAALGCDHKMVKMGFPEHRARSKTGKDNFGGFRCLEGGHIPTMRDKGCSKTFGYQKGDVEKFLHGEAQYTTLGRFHGGRDVVCVPPGYAKP